MRVGQGLHQDTSGKMNKNSWSLFILSFFVTHLNRNELQPVWRKLNPRPGIYRSVIKELNNQKLPSVPTKSWKMAKMMLRNAEDGPISWISSSPASASPSVSETFGVSPTSASKMAEVFRQFTHHISNNHLASIQSAFVNCFNFTLVTNHPMRGEFSLIQWGSTSMWLDVLFQFFCFI